VSIEEVVAAENVWAQVGGSDRRMKKKV